MKFEKTLFEAKRKLLHTIAGLFFMTTIYFDMITGFQIFLILVLGVVLSFLVRRYRIPLISKLVEYFERKEYIKTFPGKGAIFLVFGILLTYELFEKNLALASIWIITFGDAITSLVRTYYLEIKKLKKKIWFPSIFGFLVSWAGASLFIGPFFGFVASLGGMVAEYLDWEVNKNSVDDNFIIPLAAATSVIIVRKIFNL